MCETHSEHARPPQKRMCEMNDAEKREYLKLETVCIPKPEFTCSDGPKNSCLHSHAKKSTIHATIYIKVQAIMVRMTYSPWICQKTVYKYHTDTPKRSWNIILSHKEKALSKGEWCIIECCQVEGFQSFSEQQTHKVILWSCFHSVTRWTYLSERKHIYCQGNGKTNQRKLPKYQVRENECNQVQSFWYSTWKEYPHKQLKKNKSIFVLISSYTQVFRDFKRKHPIHKKILISSNSN